MAETLSMLSIISFIVAGVALAVAIFLWIFFKIPRVVGDLSGRNARKSVARVRAKLDIENPIIRINTAFKGCSSLEKISVLPRIYHN